MNKEEFILNISPANGEPSKEYVMRLNTKLLLENKELQQKVNQLETNRDEIRKLLKKNISGLDIVTDELYIRVKRVELDKYLERGKE